MTSQRIGHVRQAARYGEVGPGGWHPMCVPHATASDEATPTTEPEFCPRSPHGLRMMFKVEAPSWATGYTVRVFRWADDGPVQENVVTSTNGDTMTVGPVEHGSDRMLAIITDITGTPSGGLTFQKKFRFLP